MTLIRFICCVLLLIQMGCKVAPTDTKETGKKIDLENPDSIPAEYQEGELDDWTEWSKQRDPFFKDAYGPCMRQFGLRMSCGGCSAVYQKWIVRVDTSGSLVFVKKYKEKVCGEATSPAGFDECLKEFFYGKHFDKLKGRMFRASLGTGLSC